MIGAAFALLVGWLFIAQWIRVTVLVVAALIWLNLPSLSAPSVAPAPSAALAPAPVNPDMVATKGQTASADLLPQDAPPTNESLNTWLNNFYVAEEKRRTAFPEALPTDARPFELLVINICSLSWSDLEAVGLTSHPLWKHFDILFKEFNSATSYSGPAAIRLLRASCGQVSHKALYQPAAKSCYLFDNLARLGFKQQLMLNHNGAFGNFLSEVREYGGIQAPLMDQSALPTPLQEFDGSPLYDDAAVLERWLQGEGAEGTSPRSATFYNLVTLHDGNRFTGSSQPADYKTRARKLFDDLDTFLTRLEKSGRKVMVVIVPEHGAALTGDKMQVAGLRDIPGSNITRVPAGVKFIGMKAPHQGAAIEINQPSSYLAISELVARSLDGKNFIADQVDWAALTHELPQSAPVSENATAVAIEYQGKPWVRLNGGDWVPYPR